MDGAVAATEEPQGPTPLPVLRDDLEIVPAAAQTSGAPAWVIFDPVANRYFEIGRELLDMLALWHHGTVEALTAALARKHARHIEEQDIGEAVHFLISNALVRDIPGNDYKAMAEKVAGEQKSLLSKVMHSYLFFRIPLFRPDRFLRFAWPVVQVLFTRAAVWVYVLAGLMGLYLVSRQWDQFTGTFQYMLSWQGAAFYGASLVVVKSIHELGHAFMAVRYGLRVPTIGVAFMVLMPVLYTDTSGAWRLRSRRKRLMIDGAGVFTELALACLATLLWTFLPDGGLRLAVFAVAATSWLTSLAVNLNPLMRFDGYYILSDALGFQNMQKRGFDMARWRMRELLFGLGHPPPETLPTGMARTVILHAWATWIYRFFLFLGIAILVYAFFIKVVGIILFVIEILWFILLPVGREMKEWWALRSEIMNTRRILITGTVTAALAVAAIVPWSSHIEVPSFMTASQEQRIFAPFPSRIAELRVREGARVAKGDVLAVLAAPELDQQRYAALEREAQLVRRIDRSGSDDLDRASLMVLTNELNEVREELMGLDRNEVRQTLRAAFDGVLHDVDPELHEGLWVDGRTPFAVLLAEGSAQVRGYVSESDIARFVTGASARFIPEDPDRPRVDLTVTALAQNSSEALEQPYLAMTYGGGIAVEEQDKEQLTPTTAQYAVVMRPAENVMAPETAQRGVTHLEGEARSAYERVRRQVLKVLVREFGV